MLPLEKQVCSFELSRHLKELGIKQESYFFYEYYSLSDAYRLAEPADRGKAEIEIAAFTAAELGEMIPPLHDSCQRGTKDWQVRFFMIDTLEKKCHYSFSATEANARAKMLIYIIEHNWISDDWKKQWLIN